MTGRPSISTRHKTRCSLTRVSSILENDAMTPTQARHNEQVARIARELRQLRRLDSVSALSVALKASLPLHPVERLLQEAGAIERQRRALYAPFNKDRSNRDD